MTHDRFPPHVLLALLWLLLGVAPLASAHNGAHTGSAVAKAQQVAPTGDPAGQAVAPPSASGRVQAWTASVSSPFRCAPGSGGCCCGDTSLSVPAVPQLATPAPSTLPLPACAAEPAIVQGYVAVSTATALIHSVGPRAPPISLQPSV